MQNEVTQQSIIDKILLGSYPRTETIPVRNIGKTEISQQEPIETDSQLTTEVIKDSSSNRNLREIVTSKIFLMMSLELVFIAGLLTFIFIVPYLNAIGPNLTITIPPIYVLLSILVVTIFVYLSIDRIGGVSFENGPYYIKFGKFLISIKFSWLFKVILIIVACVIGGFVPSKQYALTFAPIILSNETLHMILLIAETVFIKTAILAGIIIKGLFKK